MIFISQRAFPLASLKVIGETSGGAQRQKHGAQRQKHGAQRQKHGAKGFGLGVIPGLMFSMKVGVVDENIFEIPLYFAPLTPFQK